MSICDILRGFPVIIGSITSYSMHNINPTYKRYIFSEIEMDSGTDQGKVQTYSWHPGPDKTQTGPKVDLSTGQWPLSTEPRQQDNSDSELCECPWVAEPGLQFNHVRKGSCLGSGSGESWRHECMCIILTVQTITKLTYLRLDNAILSVDGDATMLAKLSPDRSKLHWEDKLLKCDWPVVLRRELTKYQFRLFYKLA